MSVNLINHIASDETLARIADAMDYSNRLQVATLGASNGSAIYDVFYASSITPENIDNMFVSWWAGANNGDYTKTQLLARWFNLLNDDMTYGVRFYKFITSVSPQGELIDDSVDLGVCTPSTNSVRGTDNFCKQKSFWTVEINYEIDANGEIDVKAVDKVDASFNRNGAAGMVGVAQKSGWLNYFEDGTTIVKRYRTNQLSGYFPLPECVSPVDNSVRPFMVHAKYMAGLDSAGLPTSATNLAPLNYTYSHNSQITAWRNRGQNYSGISICDIAFRIHMFQLKYAKKGNDSVMKGCTSYNYQKTAAVSETGVQRILLTEADAANYMEGSNVIIGDMGTGTSTDRNVSSMYSLVKNKRITSIEDVTIDGTTYKALNIDNGGTTFNTVAGTTYISMMPWWSGTCDNVLGVDGSPTNCTNGKEPFIIQGLETQTGAYAVVADVIAQTTADTDAQTLTVSPAVVRLAKNISTEKTANYVTSSKTLTVEGVTGWAWHYIQDLAFDKTLPELTLPSGVDGGAGSSNGYQSAVHVVPSSGPRVWLAWADLNGGSLCGLACAYLILGPSGASWSFAAGASGSAGSRGEWQG